MIREIRHQRIRKERQVPPYLRLSVYLKKQPDTQGNGREGEAKSREEINDAIGKSHHINDGTIDFIFLCQQPNGENAQPNLQKQSQNISRVSRKNHIQ